MNYDHISAVSARKERAALWSILASSLITIAKGFAGLTTGSLAMISDAAHSLLDVASTTITWLAVRASGKPADERHPYGHGKFESLAALGETAFLFLLSGAVAFEGIRRLGTNEGDVTPSWMAVGVLLGSIAIDAWRWVALKKVARETNSEALDADALHFSSDLINSFLVLLALIAAFYGYPQVDALVAVGVSLFIALAGFRLARRTIDTLLDTAPEGLSQRARETIEQVAGVVDVKNVRVRTTGTHIFGEIRFAVSRTLPLDRVEEIKKLVFTALQADMPESDFTLIAEPVALDNETILERVMLIAARLKVPIHHVTIQSLEDNLSVSFDLEVDGRLPLIEAHKIASRVEEAIQAELGVQVEVESHIEPLVAFHLEGAEADAETISRIASSLQILAKDCPALQDIHHVRVRTTPEGLVVNYHCHVDPMMDVADVHALIDGIEHKSRNVHPDIIRIVGHAEPG